MYCKLNVKCMIIQYWVRWPTWYIHTKLQVWVSDKESTAKKQTLTTINGQLISKCLYGAFKSTKKTNEMSALASKKMLKMAWIFYNSIIVTFSFLFFSLVPSLWPQCIRPMEAAMARSMSKAMLNLDSFSTFTRVA